MTLTASFGARVFGVAYDRVPGTDASDRAPGVPAGCAFARVWGGG